MDRELSKGPCPIGRVILYKYFVSGNDIFWIIGLKHLRKHIIHHGLIETAYCVLIMTIVKFSRCIKSIGDASE